MKVIFYDEQHEATFNKICNNMAYLDCYHRSLAYLIALDNVCRQHITEIFDFQNDSIKSDCLAGSGWQTSSSIRTIKLAFNLWNGYNDLSADFTVNNIFNYSSEYNPYYIKAIQIRYEIGEE